MWNIVYTNIMAEMNEFLENCNSQTYKVKHVPLESLEKIESLNDTFAIVLSYQEGDEESISQARIIKEKHTSIPIIIISHYFNDKVSFWCLRNRIWDYIILPAEKEYFELKLQTLLALKKTEMKKRSLRFPTSESCINTLYSYTKNTLMKTHGALDYISSHYGQKITIGQLASTCNMSAWQFTSTFKKEMGSTPCEFLRKYRLNYAMCLLAGSSKSIQEIAYDVGFDDASYFSRVFKIHSGKSPNMFRQSLGRVNQTV